MSYTANSLVPYGNSYDPPPTASTKDEKDKYSYVLDFTDEFQNEPGDTIASIGSVTYLPGNGVLPDLAPNGSPSIIASPVTGVAAQAVQIPVQAGQNGITYSITVLINTTMGNTFNRSLFVPVNPL